MAAIKYKEALGMEVKRGRPGIGKKPLKKELQRLYIKESRSIRDVAKILGCSKDMVFDTLKEYGTERRNQGVKRSRLQDFKISFLEKEVRKKGVRGLARELEVHENTLRYYLKKAKEGK